MFGIILSSCRGLLITSLSSSIGTAEARGFAGNSTCVATALIFSIRRIIWGFCFFQRYDEPVRRLHFQNEAAVSDARHRRHPSPWTRDFWNWRRLVQVALRPHAEPGTFYPAPASPRRETSSRWEGSVGNREMSRGSRDSRTCEHER